MDIFSSTDRHLYRLHFDENKLELIEHRDSITYEHQGKLNKISVWPATQFLQDMDNVEEVLQQIEAEMVHTVKKFQKNKQLVEAERIQKRVMYDIRMIRET